MLNSIYQVRGYEGCLKQGFNILTDRPWVTVRVMGPWALLFSVFFVLYLWDATTTAINLMINDIVDIADVALIYLLYLILCFLNQCFIARLFIFFRRTQKSVERREAEDALNSRTNSLQPKEDIQTVTTAEAVSDKDTEEKKESHAAIKSSQPITFKEFCMAFLISLPYLIIPYILCAPGFSITSTVVQLVQRIDSIVLQIGIFFGLQVACIVIAFFLSPLVYAFYATMMEDEKPFAKNLGIAFHHKGKIFGLAILSFILSGLLTIIPSIPCCIALFAYIQSITDCVNLGDTAFIPTYGIVLMFVICVLSSAVSIIFSLTFYTPLLYLYGSIRKFEEEKANGTLDK